MKYLMLCPVLLSSLGAIAQVSVKNVDLVEGAPNVLYESWDNKVQILGLDSADLRDLTTSNGTISRSNNAWNTFTIRCKTGDSAILTIRAKGHKKTQTQFAIQKLNGATHVSLGTLTDTIATINEILSDPYLHVSLPKTYLKEWFRVVRFSLDLTSSSGSVMARFEDSRGNALTQRQMDQIKLLEPGDELRFTEMIATCPECALRSLGTMTIHIK
jgi:hypothetical protein